MQYKVPQNIDMQDKIIGPLTMAQFLYLIVAGMVDYILLQTFGQTNLVVFIILATPIALFALAMAFLKINDIPFPKFFQAAVLFMISPKVRVWHKVIDMNSPVKIEAAKVKTADKVVRKHVEKSEIEKLANVLDTAGWAAVRDKTLKEFVKGFDASHHTLVKGGDAPSAPAEQTVKAKATP